MSGGVDTFVQEAFHTFLTLPAARTLVDAPDDARNMLLVALPAEAAAVDELLAAAEDVIRLRGCVQELAEMQRAVVTLRLLDEVDGESVARTLGITAAHVAVILHRAKANLSACMTVKEEGRRHVQGNAAD